MICRCGNELPPGAGFCNKCGARQEVSAPVATETPPAVQHTYQPPQAAAPKPRSILKVLIPITTAVTAVAVTVTLLLTSPWSKSGQPDEQTGVPENSPAVTVHDVAPAAASPGASAASAALTTAEIFEQNTDAVFLINTSDGMYSYWGSGFFVDPSGVAVTNHHVMNGMTEAYITTYDGGEFEIIGYYGYDPDNDWAVIQVDGGGRSFPCVTLGDSTVLKQGERVVSIGSPSGELNMVTDGIVSRFIDFLDYSEYSVSDMIQHTAFISGGNSGGPLFDSHGWVVGINSAGSDEYRAATSNYSVRIECVDISLSQGGRCNPLPVPSLNVPAGIQYYPLFSSVPTFDSVSVSAELLLGSSISDWAGYDIGLSSEFDYLAAYSLLEQDFEDANTYIDILLDEGFVWQAGEYDEGRNFSDGWLYHAGEDVSFMFEYYFEFEQLYISIGTGNMYNLLFGEAEDPVPGGQHGSYGLFSHVPDFGLVSANAVLLGEEIANSDFTADGVTYVYAGDYIYWYSLSEEDAIEDSVAYNEVLSLYGYEYLDYQSGRRYTDAGAEIWVSCFYRAYDDVYVTYIYWYENEEFDLIVG